MMEQISKYHYKTYVGFKEDNGYRMSWNSSHPDLEPTETFSLGYTDVYCVYCCGQAYPIQAGLKGVVYGYTKNYDVTGYTCICEAAENEKLQRKELKELQERHKKEELELMRKFQPLLKQDKRKRLELKHKRELYELENDEKYERQMSLRSNEVVRK
jgi:hypothetical protein